MAYTPVHEPWEDGVDGNTPVDADALNQIEDGIVRAHEAAAAAQATADAAASQQLPFIRKDVLEQKGDLVVGAGFQSPLRLGVGGANQTIFPDASTTTGIAWGAITGSRISGFPSDAAKFLRGDGVWAAPSGGIAPTHIGAGLEGDAQPVTANRAYLMPVQNVIAATTLTRIGYRVAVSGGNYDVGIYFSDDEATFTRLVSLGSTALPSSGARVATISSSVITPVAGRRWYLSSAFSSTPQIFCSDPPGGYYWKDSSFPLPASLTSVNSGSVEVLPVLLGMV